MSKREAALAAMEELMNALCEDVFTDAPECQIRVNDIHESAREAQLALAALVGDAEKTADAIATATFGSGCACGCGNAADDCDRAVPFRGHPTEGGECRFCGTGVGGGCECGMCDDVTCGCRVVPVGGAS